MPPSKTKEAKKTLVCFRKCAKWGTEKCDKWTSSVFKANYTRNQPPCKKPSSAFHIKPMKQSAIERKVLRSVRSSRTPKVYGYNKGTVIMKRVGQSLDKMLFPRNTGGLPFFIRAHKKAFLADMTIAFGDLLKAGYVHKDVAKRNITFHNGHFFLIDFGKVDTVETYMRRHGALPLPKEQAQMWYKKFTRVKSL
jgi:RIO-like serine/threonine protein kinase